MLDVVGAAGRGNAPAGAGAAAAGLGGVVCGGRRPEKVRRIDAGARRLRREDSWHLPDTTAIDVAVCRTPELLGDGSTASSRGSSRPVTTWPGRRGRYSGDCSPTSGAPCWMRLSWAGFPPLDSGRRWTCALLPAPSRPASCPRPDATSTTTRRTRTVPRLRPTSTRSAAAITGPRRTPGTRRGVPVPPPSGRPRPDTPTPQRRSAPGRRLAGAAGGHRLGGGATRSPPVRRRRVT